MIASFVGFLLVYITAGLGLDPQWIDSALIDSKTQMLISNTSSRNTSIYGTVTFDPAFQNEPKICYGVTKLEGKFDHIQVTTL